MSWQPFIPNVEEWKNHFLTTAKMKYIPNQKTYIVGQFGEGSASTKPQIELLTPTQQVVDRAKAGLKKRKLEGGPVVVFPAPDPLNLRKEKCRENLYMLIKGNKNKLKCLSIFSLYFVVVE